MDGPKSIHNDRMSFVTFIPCTDRKVDVFWLDYNGRRVKYATLVNREHLNMQTYVTHPWVFRDAETGDKLISMGGDEVYYPKAWNGGGSMPVLIDIPVFTLKERCLQLVRKLYSQDEVNNFFIPHTLKQDVAEKENIPHDQWMYFVPVL